MKTRSTPFIIAYLLFAFAATAQKNNSDEEAIKKVIDKETRTYFEKKYDEWASTWVHDSTAYRVDISPSAMIRLTGWSEIDPGKEALQTIGSLTNEEMLQYTTKTNYQFYISGNTAMVLFKEGNTTENMNDEMRQLIKQNGEWKIQGLTIVNTSDYTFQDDVEKFKFFIGRWKLVPSSQTNVPPDSVYKLYGQAMDVYAINNGFVFSWTQAYSYMKKNYSQTEVETFIPNYSNNKFRYTDVSNFNRIATYAGVAYFDSTGKFIIKEMYEDVMKPQIINEYTIKEDGSLHMTGFSYDKDGKQTTTWEFNLQRE